MFPIRHLSRADENTAAATLGVTVEVIKAIAAVEARRSGFIKGTDLPTILFEGHKFSGFTRGKFDHDFPHISYPKWTKAHYKGGLGEYDRLLEAIRINGGDAEPALKSCSWGMFQIMGFNHELAGFSSVRDFVNDQSLGEHRQMAAFVKFIQETGLSNSLKTQDWHEFARLYNGPGYKKNNYHIKLATEFKRASDRLEQEREGAILDLARAEVKNLQVALNVAIDAGLSVDGWFGPRTSAAIRSLQRRDGLAETGAPNAEVFQHLGLDFADYEALVEA